MSKAKGKGKGNKKGDEEGPDPARINLVLQNECNMLQRQIVSEQERQDTAKSNEEAYRNRIIELDQEFTQERDKTKDIVDDMKRQYKVMEDGFMEKINILEAEVAGHESDIQNKDEQIHLLDQEIKEE